MDEIILRKHEYTVRAKQVLKRTGEDIVELSQICAEYHKEFGYQEYIRWVQDELGMSGTYGKNLLNVYENYGDRTLSVLINNFDSTALRLLSAPSVSDDAREEAQERHDSGEHISAKLAKEIANRHKAESETKAAQKELASKDSKLSLMEDRLASLEAKKNELTRENKFILENKNADANQMMNQNHKIERLNQQIEELKAQQVEPQVVTQVVKEEIRIEVVPDDYEQIKAEREKLQASLEREKAKRTKTEEDVEYQLKKITHLEKRIADKEKELSEYTPHQREIKALGLLNQAQNEILKALSYLKIGNQILCTDQICNIIDSIHKNLGSAIDESRVINI